MDAERLRELLVAVQRGTASVDAALQALRQLPFEDLGYARVDLHRALRQGVPEVVLGDVKTPEQIVGIARSLIRAEQAVFITRLDAAKAAAVSAGVPELTYHAPSRTASHLPVPPKPRCEQPIWVVTAGSSDLPVAEEARETLRVCGVPSQGLADVGVAGLQRLLGHLPELSEAPGIIVCAGMEGALASVLGGLVGCPIVAVPTSIGYGAGAHGFAALLGMLTSCAAGITVVNIDNGFGAAMAMLRYVRSAADLGVPAAPAAPLPPLSSPAPPFAPW
jgi:pyridinium-3,5-biscarboxylic acid mononucleotide synthase